MNQETLPFKAASGSTLSLAVAASRQSAVFSSFEYGGALPRRRYGKSRRVKFTSNLSEILHGL
jgi:hypothetical protein